MNPAVESALFCLDRGWVPVRVGFRSKKPVPDIGWQKLRPTAEEIARWGRCNVGVLLGNASGWLVDTDLDCAEAIGLAPHYLPETWVYGRASKPRSHWLYIVEGAQSKKFPGVDGKGALEIRGDTSNGPGHQSVMPGSVHESGESIEWDPDCADGTDGPRVLTRDEYYKRVKGLILAVLYRQQGATVEEAIEKQKAHKPAVQQTVARRSMPMRGDVVDRARKYVAKMDAAVSKCNGHTTTFLVAVALVKGFGLDENTALSIMEQDYNPRCQPPWSAKELEHKIKQAINNSTADREFLIGGGQ
jgi:hypothetical protein